MATAIQIPPNGNIPSASSFQEIPLICISESRTNPRRQFDETSLAELADFVPGNRSGFMWPSPFCGIRTS
jgi:hypothetical protein